MTCTCGCCTSGAGPSPLAVVNRPGLSRIATRIGTHGSIFAGMVARLSSHDFPELVGLRAHSVDDPAVALLDAWATVADVLTFYQEQIANEGYLRTATERRSLVELGKLVGYAPRPGVAASVHLAFGLDAEPAETRIPKGTKVNSIPGPGETMEAFETADEIVARPAWNQLKPRQTQPQTELSIGETGIVWVKGVTVNLKRGDPFLLRFGKATPDLKSVQTVTVDREHDRTGVRFANVVKQKSELSGSLLKALLEPATVAPASAAKLRRDLAASFAASADALPRLAEAFEPRLAGKVFPVLRNLPPAEATADEQIEFYALRIEARPFGHNAPPRLLQVVPSDVPPVFGEWVIDLPLGVAGKDKDPPRHGQSTIYLDNDYPLDRDGLIVIDLGDGKPLVIDHLDGVRHGSINAYGLSGKTVRIDFAKSGEEWLEKSWLKDETKFGMVRGARVFAGSEKLALADAPIPYAVAGDAIELDGLYDGLEPGRWLIVEGERADLFTETGDERNVALKGLRAAELVMLAGVSHRIRQEAIVDAAGVPVPPRAVRGDTYHTTLKLAGTTADGAAGLAYRYVRDSVTIHGNVAKATHGETRDEMLGSGDATRAFQAFKLRLPPLTHVSADTPSGVESTLELRVDGVLWREAATLAALGPAERKYVTQVDSVGTTAAIAGDGRHGRRLPSGRNNVTARYRQGIGAAGNVKPRQISLLAARPLGVKDVINPLPATGGAGPDGEKTIRRNAALAIMAMDRLVSLADYADFARAFAGVGKASAQPERVSDEHSRSRETGAVEVVIAGVGDAPIGANSDLFHNLGAALRRYGDPLVPLRLKVRKKLALVVSAQVLIAPERRWDLVEPKLRAALLDRFAFDEAELGKPLFAAEAIAALQRVPGVVAVDLDVFDALTAESVGNLGSAGIEFAGPRQRLGGAADELAWLDGSVRDTLVLTEMKR